MKKIMVFILFVIVLSSAYSDDPYMTVRPISLQAGFDTVLDISVDRIPSQSENYLQGMPFNIEDPQVQYVVDGSGRLIANWSLMSNTDFNMTIALNPMLHVSSENITEYNPLEYVLTFEYILSHGTDEDNFIDSKFSIDMENLTVAGEHVMELETPTKDSSTGVATFKVNITNDVIGDAAVSSFIGSLNGGIYFKLTQKSSNALSADSNASDYPAGNYSATVTILLEGVE